jgi:hypothetical protein
MPRFPNPPEVAFVHGNALRRTVGVVAIPRCGVMRAGLGCGFLTIGFFSVANGGGCGRQSDDAGDQKELLYGQSRHFSSPHSLVGLGR